MSQEFECLKLTMDGLFVSHALLKPLGTNRFALMANEEKSILQILQAAWND